MEKWQLKQRQSLPLEVKIMMTQRRIIEAYEKNDGQVYVSNSGGKDSTVLSHLVNDLYPDVPNVFVDTGLEYPELKQFLRKKDNLITVRPQYSFREVINKFGYPVASKKVSRAIYDLRHPTDNNVNVRNLYMTGITSTGNQCLSRKLPAKWYPLIDAPFGCSERCCDIMKKRPLKKYEREEKRVPIIGSMACESDMRTLEYLKHGCNSFNTKRKSSQPLGFWTESDILECLYTFNLDYAEVYGDIYQDENGCFQNTGVKRTGCMFCMFGVQLEKSPNRFERMRITHPSIYNHCMLDFDQGGLGLGDVLDFIGVSY